MTTNDDLTEPTPVTAPKKSNWGSKLFFVTLIAILIFFWWVLIFSGGVTGDHG